MIQVVVSAEKLNKLLLELQRQSKNTLPAMRAIAGIMMFSTEENFEKEGRPKWEDLKQKTKDRRAKKGKWPGKMLQVSSGGLAASISGKAENTRATVGTNKAYAAAHQFGYGPKNIPERPFLKLQKSDITDAEKVLIRHLLPKKEV